ncbi:sulfatase-like hydrolase/transferase [Membranihabitans marinus]
MIILLLCWALNLYSQDRPNVILIMADDLGREVLECYGNNSNFTPHINRLAREGMIFENCHSTPLCTPSRVQIMTGKYNFRNYIGFGLLDPNEKTFGHYFKEAGYSTCIVGKWQLYGNQKQQELAGGRTGSLPKEAGFDKYLLWQVKDRGYRYGNPTLENSEGEIKLYPKSYGPDLFTEYIEDFITDHQEEPFFVYYPMTLVHDPFEPTPFSKNYNNGDEKVNDTTHFSAMVRYMDDIVGRIVDRVETLNLSSNTLILFIGDNGTDRDVISINRGQKLRGNKGYTNDLGTHVPMIAHWPGSIDPGQVNERLVDFTDFLPSFLDLIQSSASGDDLDGISFIDNLKDPDSPHNREWIFCSYDPHWGKFKPSRFIYNTHWKIYGDGSIYDLENDLYEKYPLKITDIPPSEKSVIDNLKLKLDSLK